MSGPIYSWSEYAGTFANETLENRRWVAMIANTIDVSDRANALSAADWLSLAAAPTFAIMALLTAVLGGAPLYVLCSAAQNASPMNGMVAMYMLMCAFHAAPWLKLITGRRRP
jgi:hypothetical protein